MAEGRKLNSERPFGLGSVNGESLMLGLGYTREDLKKPRIGVFNTWNDYNPGHLHLKDVAKAASEGIYSAGGIACNFNCIGFCDSLQAGPGYALASRDNLCNSIEVMAKAQQLDGMIIIATCDKNVPAANMAAARVNIPAIVITGGQMTSNCYDGHVVDFIDVNKTLSAVKEGTKTREYLEGLVDVACPGVGACNMMGTADTMQTVTEVIGMSLPGNSGCIAAGRGLIRIAREAGRQVMKLWEQDIRPRDIITNEAIENAVRVLMAIGGSTNSMYHVPAIATEAKLDCNVWDYYDKASFEVPLLCGIRPVGENTFTEFDNAGGIRAMLNVIKDCGTGIHTDCLTVNGKTLGENIAGWTVKDTSVIHTLDDPISVDGGICILHGNIVPDGCAAKQSTFPRNMLKFSGPAKVYYSPKDAIEGIYNGEIQEGDFVVILFLGAKAGPGMGSAYGFTSALAGSHLAGKVAMVTDGRFSGAASGAIVGYASPEAGLKGPICAIQNGDIIDMDIEKRTINVRLSDEEIAQRVAAFDREITWHTGYLGLYQSWIGSLSKGATLSGKNNN